MVSNRRANDPSTDGKLVGECQVSETAANKRKGAAADAYRACYTSICFTCASMARKDGVGERGSHHFLM